MTPAVKSLRLVLLAGAAQLALSYAPLGISAAITLADPNCDSFSLSGTPGNQTLTCVVSSAPVCQINGASTGQVGSSVALTATCSGQPTSYQWTGGNCTTGPTCNATHGAPEPVNYTVIATNNVGIGGPSPTKTVSWSDQPVVVAPSGCTLTPSQTPVSSGTVVTLTASCNGGGAATGWNWTGSGAQSATVGPSQQVIPAATTSYTVTPYNSGGNGNTASTTVTISASSGGGGTIQACAGFTNTKVIDATVPVNGGANNRYFTSTSSVFNGGAGAGFGANDALIVRFTAPTSDAYFSIGMNETGTGATGAPTYRTMSLSTQPCDFSIPKSANALWAYEDTGFSLNLSAAGSQRNNLQPGATYYINVKNYAFGNTPMCTASRCDVFFTFGNPFP